MDTAQIIQELQIRLNTGLAGFKFGTSGFEFMYKSILNQAYIDGLFSEPPLIGKPFILSVEIKPIEININWVNKCS